MSLQWFNWHTVTERLQARLYALTKGKPYRVRLDTTTPTGYCDFRHKIIGVNPIAFDAVFVKEKIKGKDKDDANFLISRALLGHEAQHTIYTDPKDVIDSGKSQALKDIMNILEDARIENIGAQQSHISDKLFQVLSAVILKVTPEFDDPNFENPYSPVSVLVRWRHRTKIPELGKDARKLWIKIRNLAEDALYAPTSKEVVECAKKIVELLGLENEEKNPNQQREELRKSLSNTSSQQKGGGNAPSSPKKNPLEKPSDSDNTPSNSSKETAEGEKDQNSGADPKEDTSDSQGKEDITDAQSDGTDNQSDDGEDTSKEDSSSDDTETPEENTDGSPENESSEDEIDLSQTDLSDLINETQGEVGDCLNGVVPEGDHDTLLFGAAHGSGQVPIIGTPYMDIYEEAIPIAQILERELKMDNPKAVTGASQYPGKFKSRYYIRNESKPFAKQNFRGMGAPEMALSLVLDRSGSMDGMIHSLKVMTIAIYIVCERLKIPLDIWALEGQVHLKSFDEWGSHILAKIAGIRACTGTTMMPTLTSATNELKKRSESLKQIVMIHDGGPMDRSSVVSWRENLRNISLFCMYIVPASTGLENVTKCVSTYMDSLVGPRNYVVSGIDKVASAWCSFMKTKRSAYSTRAG